MEFHSGIELIFGVLDDAQAAFLQNVVKRHIHSLTGYDRHFLSGLGNVVICHLLCDRVGAGDKALQKDRAVSSGLHCLIQPITGNGHGNIIDLAVFTGLDDIEIAAGSFDFERGDHIIRLRDANNHVLQRGIAVSYQLSRSTNAGTLSQRDRGLTVDVVRACEGQRIAGLRDLDGAVRSGNGTVGQNAVVIRKRNAVLAVFIGHRLCGTVSKAGHFLIHHHVIHDVVIHRTNFGVMPTSANTVQNTVIIQLKCHRISSAANHLPNKELCCDRLRTVRTADSCAVTRAAKCEHGKNAILHIGAQPVPAVRSAKLELVAKDKMMTRLNAPCFFLVNPNSDTMGCTGSIARLVTAKLKVVMVHDFGAVRFIREVEIRNAALGRECVCLHREHTHKHQAAKEHSEDALRMRIKIFTHVVPSFMFFVLLG